MATEYARLVSDVVVELISLPDGVDPSTVFNSSLTIVTITGGQTPAVGWTYSGGTFTAPVVPSPTLSQLAAQAITNGMQMTSTSDSALNATYPCDLASNANDTGLLALIGAGVGLPGGMAVVLDTTGTPRVFTETQFKTYAGAKAAFLQTLNTIVGSNSGTLPTQPVVIA